MKAFISINRGSGGAEKQFDRLYEAMSERPSIKGHWSYLRCDRAVMSWWSTLACLLRIRNGVVVYNMSVLGIGVFFLLLLKALGNKIILYPHVVVAPEKSRPRLWRLRAWLQRLSLGVADHVIMISDGNWFELEKYLPPGKSTAVYNYVECENDAVFTLQPLNRNIAVIGRLQNKHKQQIDLVREHGAFIKELGLVLHFFGSGPDESELREQVRILGMQEYAIFHGWQDEESIFANDFSFVLNISRWEGLPLSVMEALYRDRIVLASDINGNRELVYGDFLFKNHDELRNLLRNVVLDQDINISLLQAQKQRLFKRCNQARALATLDSTLLSICQKSGM